MEWKTLKHSNKHTQQPFVSFKPKWDRVYFSKKLLHDYFNNYQHIILRVAEKTRLVSFQPVAEKTDTTFKLIITRKGSITSGADISCKGVFKYKFMPKKTTRFIPHWDPKIEWLTINLNGKGENNENT